MDVPILVAIISVSGTLLGTVVGGSIVTWGNYFLARRRERLEFRTACRLISAELQANHHTVEFALGQKRWWRSDEVGVKRPVLLNLLPEELGTEAWQQFQNILAPHLPYDAWQELILAVRAVNHVNRLAGAPRPPDRPDEIFFEETVTALTLFMKDIDRGRVSLRPYLSLAAFSRMRASRLRQWWYLLTHWQARTHH
jgi:hypothetical protein